MAMIVVLVLVSIVFIYLGANLRTLHVLGRDLRLIERQQIRRLATKPAATPAPAQVGATNQPPIAGQP
jgi:hypothetical protein